MGSPIQNKRIRVNLEGGSSYKGKQNSGLENLEWNRKTLSRLGGGGGEGAQGAGLCAPRKLHPAPRTPKGAGRERAGP